MKKGRRWGVTTRRIVSFTLLILLTLSVCGITASAIARPVEQQMKGSKMLHASGSIADVGNFRGNSDFDFDSGGGSHRDFDFSSDSGSGSSLSLDGPMDFLILAVFGVPGFIIWLLIQRSRGRGTGTVQQPAGPSLAVRLQQLQQRDPFFSIPALEEKAARLYVEMQTCWSNKRWEPMRAHMSAQLYGQLENQLKDMDRQGMTNHIERVAVLQSEIRDYEQDDTNDIISVYLKTRIVDYTTDRAGKVVVGSPTAEVFMEYRWELIRSMGVRTPGPQEKDVQRQTCSGCGAPIDVNHSAKCEYCGSIVIAKEYDWVINRMEAISQRSVE